MLALVLLLAAQADLPSDDRVLGHLPYAEAYADELVAAPPGFAVGQPCRVHAATLPDLVALVDAARASGLALRGVSCFRSVARQRTVFCRTRRACRDSVARAVSVGPPGHSEHATGYAVDFTTRPMAGCGDVSECFADMATGRWLLANGPRFGFELSFPLANAQAVAWEPWHWRWVGRAWDAPGAAVARTVFARARASYPARPAATEVIARPLPDQVASLPAVTATLRPR